jgi:hypothetical protein
MYYEYIIVFYPIPTKDEVERGVTPKAKLLIGPEGTMASNDREAGLIAARSIPEEYVEKLEQIDVILRPFAVVS